MFSALIDFFIPLKSLHGLKVVCKNYYGAKTETFATEEYKKTTGVSFAGGKDTKESGFAEASAPQIVNFPESWSFIVEGTDKKGKVHHKEIYVDSETWYTTELASPYTIGEGTGSLI